MKNFLEILSRQNEKINSRETLIRHNSFPRKIMIVIAYVVAEIYYHSIFTKNFYTYFVRNYLSKTMPCSIPNSINSSVATYESSISDSFLSPYNNTLIHAPCSLKTSASCICKKYLPMSACTTRETFR